MRIGNLLKPDGWYFADNQSATQQVANLRHEQAVHGQGGVNPEPDFAGLDVPPLF